MTGGHDSVIEMDVAARRKEVGVSARTRAVNVDEPPSNYLVLGDFGGSAASPIAVDRDHFDEALSRMDVRLGSLPFHALDDFHPDRLCRRVPLFRDSHPPAAPEPEKTAAKWTTESIDPFQRYLREFAQTFASSKHSRGKRSNDTALAERLRGVLHHPQFQAIEAAWRGVDFLLRRGNEDRGANSGGNGAVRVFVAQYSRDDVNRDLLAPSMSSPGRGETRLQELLNAQRWRAIGGLYKFGPDAFDIEVLRQLALLAARARAPFVAAWSLAAGPADMGPYWSDLTAIPEADHLGLVLPGFLLRLPYGAGAMPIGSFPFEEMPGVPVHSRYLWGNPSLACLALLARGGGALDVTGLPLHIYEREGKVTTTPCTEAHITEVHELALIEAGLMPLVPSPKNDCARLSGFRAINGTELPMA